MRTRTATIDESTSAEGPIVAMLTITAPGQDTIKVPITNVQSKIVIGRDARADVQINNQVVSRLHAVISQDRGKFSIEDLHSKNGTLLNGKYLSGKPTRLADGDEVRIGKIVMLFQSSSPEGSSHQDNLWRQPATTESMIIPTGYNALDAKLGGGIPKGYAIVLLSHSCDERDLLLKRIVESSVRAGRQSFLISNDLSKITQFSAFTSGFYAFSNRAGKTTQDDHAGPIWIPGVENLSELNISLSEGIARIHLNSNLEKLMVIEILPDILLEHKSLITRRWLADFIAKRKAQLFTEVFTLNPSIAPEAEVSAVTDLFDGALKISELETKSGSRTFISVRRMFARRYDSKEVPLSREELLQ